MNANERCEPPPELLPCPFCGGTDGQFATDAHSPNYIGKWGWWECACGARAEDVRTGYDATGWQDAAVAAWNRRVTQPATVAALVEALEGLMVGSVWEDTHTFYDGTPMPAGWSTKRMPDDDALTAARAALALYRGEAGR